MRQEQRLLSPSSWILLVFSTLIRNNATVRVMSKELQRAYACFFFQGCPGLHEQDHGAVETAAVVAASRVMGPVGGLAGAGAVPDSDVADSGERAHGTEED